MRRATQLVAVVAAVALSPGLAIGGDQERTLTGSYHWTDGGRKGELRAVFTPTGEARWDVAFHFEFSGEPHVYSGTAEGTLTGGVLKGRVLNEGRNRSFIFTGAFTEGVFHGTHAETTDDGEHATGSLSLKMPSGRAANRVPEN